jgi:hypothetical protein
MLLLLYVLSSKQTKLYQFSKCDRITSSVGLILKSSAPAGLRMGSRVSL